MKTLPIVPARIELDAEGLPTAPDFGDRYHASAGAQVQSQAVFLAGNGLPQRWAGRERFTILETGFGLGHNFLATLQAWRDDPQRCERLDYVALEKHPPTRADLARLQAHPLATDLVHAWPPLTPGIHVLDFDHGRVRLLLALGEGGALLRELQLHADAIYLDGFAPSRNAEMWDERIFKPLARLAAPGCTAATWSVARTVRDGLGSAGFVVERRPGFADKRDRVEARFEPRHVAAPPAGGLHRHQGVREALIVGAGLAGAAAAWALAREDSAALLDRAASPATGASGNAAGLFHGTLSADDGPHARAHRAAALRAAALLRPWIAGGRVRGSAAGLLRAADRDGGEAAGLPHDYVQWLDAEQAAARSGLPAGPGWWFPAGGWVEPASYVRALIEDSASSFVGGVEINAIERRDGLWHALDAHGASISSAPVLVLANAADAARLAGPAIGRLSAVRGQISAVPATAALAEGLVGALPGAPVAGAGYALPVIDGLLWCGATTHHDDVEPALRDIDHRHNLNQLARLSGGRFDVDAPLPAGIAGRVGWRALTPDRLPLVGAVPDVQAWQQTRHADRPRRVPRLRDAHGGLYVLGGLGSRGITWAALCGELLASWVSGASCPLEGDLRDALDPARALLRS